MTDVQDLVEFDPAPRNRGRLAILWDGFDDETGKWGPESPCGMFLHAVRTGASFSAAARFGGFSPASLAHWLDRAQIALNDCPEMDEISPDLEDLPYDDRPYVALAAAAAIADARIDIELVTAWRVMAKDDWRAARDMLDRRHSGGLGNNGSQAGPQIMSAERAGLGSSVDLDELFDQRPDLAIAAAEMALALSESGDG